MNEFKVAEKFVSINGEARRAGELAVFIRFVGCNLNCSYCDTAWAIPMDAPGEQESIDSLLKYVDESGVTNVTLTGGEPLLQNNIEKLIEELIKSNHRVEIETNGAVSIERCYKLAKELEAAGQMSADMLSITLDYKCPSSGMQMAMKMENYKYLRSCDTVKFVVGSVEDLDAAKSVIDVYKLTEKCAVFLSPVFGNIQSTEIVDYMIENKMNGVTHQLQQHKFIWDPNARGV